MKAARIHLARMSPLLRRMIMDLLEPETDMEIVGSAKGAEEALTAARAEGANLIITQGDGANDECLGAIVSEVPLTILVIDAGGAAGTSIDFRRRRHSLQPGDGHSLAQVVRKALEPT